MRPICALLDFGREQESIQMYDDMISTGRHPDFDIVDAIHNTRERLRLSEF